MAVKGYRIRPRIASAQSGQGLALRCAHQVAASIDRRMPEAGALASWLHQHASSLGLPETDMDADHAPARRDAGIPAPAWRRIVATIAAGARTTDRKTAAANAPAELWLDAVATKLGFDPLDRGVLSLAIHYGLDQRVERLVDALCSARGSTPQLSPDPALLALLLAAGPGEIEARLGPTAPLLDSGVLRIDRDGALEVVSALLSLIRRATLPGPDIFDQLLGANPLEPLPWDAFAHLGRPAEVAADLLRAALAGRETGINLLLYGPPGTGKTSFAATLAQALGARLRPVTEQDGIGGEPTRYERLAGLRLAQRLAPPGESLLLFDEAEDVFVQRSIVFDEPAVSSRVFMHRLLEQNAHPVIWTANDIRVLGPAALRRMTMCLELAVPALAARTRLWRQIAETERVPLPEAEAARLARLVPAAPGLASTALRATRLAGGDAATARLIVEGIARAVAGGHGAPPPPEPDDAAYDPALVNADRDLLALADTLADTLARPGPPGPVSLLLSGPPGTGKSAWVRHLAARMGIEVLQKRASDLLDPFVGGTEHRIAAAFAEAREQGAFLIFDEADSLLLDRAGAHRSFEVSQVNEMLTWMEHHPLPFACTTNLPDRLDRASLRRFLIKLRFDWLTRAQARHAFACFYALPPPEGLDALRTLTPADFALVRRRVGITGETADAAALLRLLAAEAEGRVGGRVTVGFTQPQEG